MGKIMKGIAGLYYVHVAGSGVYECKAKGISGKTGSNLLWETTWRWRLPMRKIWKAISYVSFRGRNELVRPAVANIDQALVVFAVTKPKPHFNLLDRFLL